MSHEEVNLGASLYVKAVWSGLPQLLKDGGAEVPAEAFAPLRDSFRDMGTWLATNRIVKKTKKGVWYADQDAIDKLPEERAKELAPLYDKAVKAHEPLSMQLFLEGKGSYVRHVRSAHLAKDFGIDDSQSGPLDGSAFFDAGSAPASTGRGGPAPSIIKEADLHKVVAASLNFLQAAHNDPDGMKAIADLSIDQVKDLEEALLAADYMLPGENPLRKAPLSMQAPRGTREQSENIFLAAATIASNMEVDDMSAKTFAPLAAISLADAVNSAEVEPILYDRESIMAFSDLTEKDAESTLNVVVAGMKLLNEVQFDPSGTGEIAVPRNTLDELDAALIEYDENGVANALSRDDFGAPGIVASEANQLERGIEYLRGLTGRASFVEGELALDGDENDENAFSDVALDMESGSLEDEGADRSSANEADITASEAAGRMLADRAIAADPSLVEQGDDKTTATAEFLDGWTGIAETLHQSGAMTALARMVSREDEIEPLFENSARMSVEQPNLADEENSRSRTSVDSFGIRSDLMSNDQWKIASANRGETIRANHVTPGAGIFETLLPDVALRHHTGPKMLSKWVADSMTNEDGTPNLKLRRALRESQSLPVVAPTRAMAETFRKEGAKFIAREREEYQSRTEEKRSDRDVKEIEIPARSAKRWATLVEASGSAEPGRLMLGADGAVVLSHEDAPRIDAKLDRLGNLAPSHSDNTVKGGPNKGRTKFGPGSTLGLITADQLRAAVETGAEKIAIMVEDDRPAAVMGKTEQVMAKAAIKPRDRFPDLTLS